MPTEAEREAASRHPAQVRPSGGWAPFVLAAFVGFGVGDCVKPAGDQFGARLALGAIDAYRATLSPLLGRSGLVRCRFQPTCSAFARQAIARYGLPRGAALAMGRLLRCHPLAKGGYDPVP